jgi:hypothetical protein
MTKSARNYIKLTNVSLLYSAFNAFGLWSTLFSFLALRTRNGWSLRVLLSNLQILYHDSSWMYSTIVHRCI